MGNKSHRLLPTPNTLLQSNSGVMSLPMWPERGGPCPAPMSLVVFPRALVLFQVDDHPSQLQGLGGQAEGAVSCRSQARYQPCNRRTPPVPIRGLKPPLHTSIAWGTFKIREAPRFRPLGFCFGGSGTPGCLYFHSPASLWAAGVARRCPKAPALLSEANQSLHPSPEAGPVVGHFPPD